MSIVETGKDTADRAQDALASTPRPRRSRRRRLSQDEERAIAQLYAETSTPTSDIRERFGIGESSLYRVLQRHGVALRGRTASPAPAPAPARRAPRRTRTVRVAAASGARFRIQFRAERVFKATDVRDALRQAESLGATEIVAVARAD